MKFPPKQVILTAGAALFIAIGIANFPTLNQPTKDTRSRQQRVAAKPNPTPRKITRIDWRKPSENQPYPDVNAHPDMWIKVSEAKQRVYLMDHDKVLYMMYCSTGSGGDRATPTGTYQIQPERGDHFFNQASGEGANYWVSWKDHGIYLFHSVPVDAQGHYVESEAQQLGKRANSHGCIRLSVPDAKWMYQNIKVGTKVVITND